MAPRVVIAGTGSLSRYLADELTKAGYAVTIMGRSKKPYFDDMANVTSQIVDYNSVEAIKDVLGDDTEVLISAILDYSMELNTAQLNMIKAAAESPRTRRFIPSEFGGNVEEYPDQTPFYLANRGPARKILAEQSTLEWTIMSTNWFLDWVVPAKNRYFPDIGDAFPVNLKEGKFYIPGAGIERLDMVTARDTARAVVELIKAPWGSWESYTYVSSEKTTWNAVAESVRKAYPEIDFKKPSYISLTQMIDNIVNAKDEEEKIIAQYQIMSVSNAGNFDEKKVAAHREKYFKNINFRTVQDVLEQVKNDQNVVV